MKALFIVTDIGAKDNDAPTLDKKSPARIERGFYLLLRMSGFVRSVPSSTRRLELTSRVFSCNSVQQHTVARQKRLDAMSSLCAISSRS
jgi:hypothetical protein